MKEKLMKASSHKSSPLTLSPKGFFDAVDIIVNFNNDARNNSANPSTYVNKIPTQVEDKRENLYRNQTAAAGAILQNLTSNHFFSLASSKFQSVPLWLADLMLNKIKDVVTLYDSNGYDVLGYEISQLPYFYPTLLLSKAAYQNALDPAQEFASMKGLHSFVSTEFRYYSMMNGIGGTAKAVPLILSREINNQFIRIQSFDDYRNLIFYFLSPLIERFNTVHNISAFTQNIGIHLHQDKKSIVLSYDKSVQDDLAIKLRAYLFAPILNFNSITQFDPLTSGLSCGFTVRFVNSKTSDLSKYSKIGNLF